MLLLFLLAPVRGNSILVNPPWPVVGLIEMVMGQTRMHMPFNCMLPSQTNTENPYLFLVAPRVHEDVVDTGLSNFTWVR